MNEYYQVKVIGNADSPKWLESEINNFLDGKQMKLIDIKYQNWCANGPGALEGQDIFSAMIIYKEVLLP